MLIVMKQSATAQEVEGVVERIRSLGLTPMPSPAPSDRHRHHRQQGRPGRSPFEGLPGVREVLRVSQPVQAV